MKQCRIFLYAIVVALVITSCSKSNEKELTQSPASGINTGGTCDTTNMSFVTNIKPILQTNCYSCHSNANYSISGIKLEDYADLKVHVDHGDVIGVITHAPGYPPMPQGNPKLSDCDINKIRAWIGDGALNN